MINETFKSNTRPYICIEILTRTQEKSYERKILHVYLTKLIKSSLKCPLEIELLILFSKDKMLSNYYVSHPACQ